MSTPFADSANGPAPLSSLSLATGTNVSGFMTNLNPSRLLEAAALTAAPPVALVVFRVKFPQPPGRKETNTSPDRARSARGGESRPFRSALSAGRLAKVALPHALFRLASPCFCRRRVRRAARHAQPRPLPCAQRTGAQQTQELRMAMARHALVDDPAGDNVERRNRVVISCRLSSWVTVPARSF